MVKETRNTPAISIVIPLYREAPHLPLLLREIQRAVAFVDEPVEVILVDDGSPDNTWAVIREETSRYPMLRAVRLSRNFGKESALCAGLEIARGEAVIVMDGDLQHPPRLIPEMIKLWRESGADVIEAVKESRGRESLAGKMGASLFYAMLRILSGYDLRGASDFKLLDRKVVAAWLKMGERNLFFRGMTAWLGFKRMQIPFVVPERAGGQSGWSAFRLVRLAMTGVSAFSSLPLHFVTVSGGIFLIFSFGLGAQTLYLKATGRAVSGFATVILLLLFIGSLLMISLGIMGEYIARIYEEVKNRPRYVIAEQIALTQEDENKG